MIFMLILEIAWSIVFPIISIVFPALPAGFSSVLEYILNLAATGCQYAVWLFFTPQYVSAVFRFLLTCYVSLLALDLIWKVIALIKLRRDSN